MHFWYLPTIDYPLWPCVGLVLLIVIPVTIWHERAWRQTLRDYGDARASAGANDPWPPEGMGSLLGVQPWLLLTAAGLLATMTALGFAALLVWPRTLPFFDTALNYFDRPYVAGMVVAGAAAVVGAVALGVDLARSPWAPVAGRLRRATHRSPEERARLFAAAIAADPGVRQARQAAEGSSEPPEASSSRRETSGAG